nr:hypothetical protein [Cytophagales bacterium]
MFHRVKSDVQPAEQKKEEIGNDYRSADEGVLITPRRTQGSRDDDSEKQQTKRTQGVSYGKMQSNAQEETKTMSSREEKSTRGYTSNDEDDDDSTTSSGTAQTTTGAYQPNIPRASGYNASTPSPVSSPSPYGGSNYSRSAAQDTYSGGDRVLTIGRGINMSGEIESCDHLMVEGTVEAALKGAKLLEIAESGTFYGTVEIEEATIAGRFEGDLTVSGRLTVKSTGVITGSIAYRTLEVESGAVVDGRLTPLKEAVDPKSADRYRAGTDASTMAKSKEDASGKKHRREPANTGNPLFSQARRAY